MALIVTDSRAMTIVTGQIAVIQEMTTGEVVATLLRTEDYAKFDTPTGPLYINPALHRPCVRAELTRPG